MVRHRRFSVILGAVVIVAAVAPSLALAVGMSDSYPRTVAVTGTGEGVSLTRMQASIRPGRKHVRVVVRLAGVSVAGTRRLTITAAPCTVAPGSYRDLSLAPDAPSRPTCRVAARRSLIVGEQPFAVTGTLRIPRPARRPSALRIQVRATGSDPILSCTRLLCRDPRFALTGDLLLNGNAWTFKPGTWWGITVTPRPGLTLDRVIYNSRMAGWVATSSSQASILTTQGYANEPATKSTTAALSAGVQTGYDTGAFGGEGQLRPAMRVLDYATAIDGAHLFTVTLPLPRWARP